MHFAAVADEYECILSECKLKCTIFAIWDDVCLCVREKKERRRQAGINPRGRDDEDEDNCRQAMLAGFSVFFSLFQCFD